MLPDTYTPRTTPFLHQVEALDAGYRREEFAYLLEMGLGKSRVLIDDFCLNFLEEKVEALCIIAPKSVYTNWTRVDDENPGELQLWLWEELRGDVTVHLYRAGKRKSDEAERFALMDYSRPGAKILVVNVEALAMTQNCENLVYRFLKKYKTMMVIDESTTIKSHKSIRTKSCLKLAPFAVQRRILTGKPSTGSHSDYWSQFEFLRPGRNLLGYRLFSMFRSRFCIMKDLYMNGRTIKVEAGSQNTEELARLVAQHSFRRTKKQCLDLPPKVYMRREVSMTDEQEKVYRELKRTAMAKLDNGQEITTQLVMTQLMRMHQVICGHVKTDDGMVIPLKNERLDALTEIIEGTDEQIVIWTCYRPDADVVVKHLRALFHEDDIAQYHGGRTQQEREREEADFQAGRRRFMVATKAGARGRTWTAGTCVIYYSNDYDLEIREQSEDRTHRIGTVGTVTYWDIVCPGTVDEKIIKALRAKRDITRAVLRDGLASWI